jgi:hypothetical protein
VVVIFQEALVMTLVARVHVVVLVGALIACEPRGDPLDDGLESGAELGEADIRGLATLDQQYATIARVYLPGFAGIAIEDGVLLIFTTEPENIEAAREVLSRVYPGLALQSEAPLEKAEFREVDYDYAMLLEWRRRVVDGAPELGIVRGSIDVPNNLVFLGVEHQEDVPVVKDAASQAGPIEAFRIEQTGPLHP